MCHMSRRIRRVTASSVSVLDTRLAKSLSATSSMVVGRKEKVRGRMKEE